MKKSIGLILFLCTLSLFAQDPISLYQQFNGSFDFASFGNTLNIEENGPGTSCSVLNSSSATFMLDPDQTLTAAYLYWAGSGTGDFDVSLNGNAVTPDRTFSIQGGATSLPFFSGFADVTSIVANNTDGNYTFSDFEIDVSGHCSNGLNFGGWSVLVIFDDPDLTNERQVSVFDGFEAVSENNNLNITLNFLSITDENESRLQFLAWEGDAGLDITEQVRINGNVLSDPPLNPADNAFNGTNTYTGASDLYNMDIDVYEIDDYVMAGDESASIALTSGRDLVIVNNIVAVYNSEVDLDAVIEINDVAGCGSRNIIVDYTVSNIGTIGLMASNTPIAFYADNVLVGQSQTMNFLSPNESENGLISLPIPLAIPNTFTLRAVADDTGTGSGVIDESDENNNDFSVSVTLPDPAVPLVFSQCDNLDENDGIASFDLTSQEDLLINGQNPALFDISFYNLFDDALFDINPITNPSAYVNDVNPQVVYARVGNNQLDCFDIVEVILQVYFLPEGSVEPSYRLCLDGSGNPIQEVEGESSPPIIDTGLTLEDYTFNWTVDGNTLADDLNPGLDETDPLTIATVGGLYEITITDRINGCVQVLTTTVMESSPPITFSAEVISNAFDETHIIEATATGLGDYIFSLDDGFFQESGLFNDVLPGNHKVTIKDANGCGSVMVMLTVIDYPRFVTPNEDGFHDDWNIIGITSLDPRARIYIFDRYGKLLKQISPLGAGWDGTYNGNPMPSSDYWFRVEYMEDQVLKEFRGHFTLKR